MNDKNDENSSTKESEMLLSLNPVPYHFDWFQTDLSLQTLAKLVGATQFFWRHKFTLQFF